MAVTKCAHLQQISECNEWPFLITHITVNGWWSIHLECYEVPQSLTSVLNRRYTLLSMDHITLMVKNCMFLRFLGLPLVQRKLGHDLD